MQKNTGTLVFMTLIELQIFKGNISHYSMFAYFFVFRWFISNFDSPSLIARLIYAKDK